MREVNGCVWTLRLPHLPVPIIAFYKTFRLS
jgi:hypothetical protein